MQVLADLQAHTTIVNGWLVQFSVVSRFAIHLLSAFRVNCSQIFGKYVRTRIIEVMNLIHLEGKDRMELIKLRQFHSELTRLAVTVTCPNYYTVPIGIMVFKNS